MQRSPRLRARLNARLIGAATVGVLAVASAAAWQQPAAADTSATTITVFLNAPHPAALAELASSHGLSRRQRLDDLAALVPSRATRAGVVAALADRGLRLVGETTWSVTVTGPAMTTAALFGTRPSTTTGTRSERIRAAASAFPRVPDILAGAVSAVFPVDAGRPVFQHAALAGPAFRNAYTPATKPASTGQNDGGLTIATLQLANFYGTATPNFTRSKNAYDLRQYASDHNLSNLDYTAVKVDGGPTSDDDAQGGDVEVALDQESMLSTAPTAHQRAYFAPNSSAGYEDVFAQVYDDATGGSLTSPIAAMSVSWGGCESDTHYSGIHSLEPILQSLVAAGVTIFAASGDAGIYDCSDGRPDVDYPASSPYVIGTGASYLSGGGANTGSNWTESAWSCTGASSCSLNAHGGTGGGASGMGYLPGDPDGFGGFPAPGYQQAGIDTAWFANQPKRLVPDIVADGASGSGFLVYSARFGYQSVAGSSLSSPISAAGLTNALGDAGKTAGAGDIHGAMYSAYRLTRGYRATDPRKAFRDITDGQNGNRNDRSTDPSVFARPGYDTVSGLGAPLWSAILPYVYGSQAPTVQKVSFYETAPRTAGWRSITANWTVSRGADPRLPGPSHMTVTRVGSSRPTADYYVFPSSSSRSFTAQPGATYRVTIQGRDIGGRQSAPSSATVVVPIDDTLFSYGPKWQRTARSDDLAGTHLNTTTKGAYTQVSGYGRSYALRLRVGPDGGTLGVVVNGQQKPNISLYAPTYQIKLVTIPTTTQLSQRNLTLTDLGSKRIGLDGLRITY